MTARSLIALLVAAATLPVAAQSDGWDAKFRAIPEARNVREYVRTLSARPHHLQNPAFVRHGVASSSEKRKPNRLR